MEFTLDYNDRDHLSHDSEMSLQGRVHCSHLLLKYLVLLEQVTP